MTSSERARVAQTESHRSRISIEKVIETGTTSTQVVGGVTRTVYTSGTVQVVTEQGGRIVVTVNPFSGVP